MNSRDKRRLMDILTELEIAANLVFDDKGDQLRIKYGAMGLKLLAAEGYRLADSIEVED